MSWARFDDHYPMHRKARRLSDAAFRLDVSAICWCSAHLTDGFIPADDLCLISDVRHPEKVATELVTRGRWEVADGGWRVHDYLDFNLSADEIRSISEKRAQAGSRGGSRSRRRPTAPASAADELSNEEASCLASASVLLSTNPSHPKRTTKAPTESAPSSRSSKIAERQAVANEITRRWWEAHGSEQAQPFVAVMKVIDRALANGMDPVKVGAAVMSLGARHVAISAGSITNESPARVLSLMPVERGMGIPG